MAEVRLEVDVAHPPERVWRALTDARLLAEWFMPTDFEPREGSRFELDPGSLRGFSGPVSAELVEIVAPSQLVMLWQGEKLHTRVTWELSEIVGGCKLRVLQTGFIGAPATMRRRELRHTYTHLFAERLPAVLEQLAAGEVDLGGSAVASLRTAVPRPRRSRANAPVGAWAAGRRRWARPLGAAAGLAAADAVAGDDAAARAGTVDAAASVDGTAGAGAASAGLATAEPTTAEPATGPATPGESDAGGGSGPATVPAQRHSTEGHPQTSVTPTTGRQDRRRRFGVLLPPRWRQWVAAAPAWARFVAIGTAAGVLAVAVLAALSSAADLHPGAPPQSDPRHAGPGVGMQPGATSAPLEDAGHAAGDPVRGRSSTAPDEGPDDTLGAPGREESPDASPTGGEPPPEGTPTSGPSPPGDPAGPELTAGVGHSAYGLLGLSGRRVAVTVANPGPGPAQTWTVTMDVGGQEVKNVSGAAFERDGSVVTFTPTDGPLPEDDDQRFSFDIPSSGLLGLEGTDPPTDCTIDGRPCG